MIAKASSYGNQAAQILEVVEKTLELRKSLSLSDLDARSVALNNLQLIAEASFIRLNFFHNWASGGEHEKAFILKTLGIDTRSQELVDRYGYALNNTARLAHLTLSLFQVENLFLGLARELQIDLKRPGIFSLTQKILNALGLDDHLKDCVIVMANIRNSQHHNGIFRAASKSNSETFVIDGEAFAFLDGKPVDCADWEYVAHIQNAILRTLEAILTAAAVKAIKDPMFEVYSASKVDGMASL